MIKVYLAEGVLEPLSNAPVKAQAKSTEPGKPAKPAEPAEKVLAKLPVKEAVKTAGETINMELLERWLKVEKRKEVKKAIEKQIEEIKAPPVYREREGTQPQ